MSRQRLERIPMEARKRLTFAVTVDVSDLSHIQRCRLRERGWRYLRYVCDRFCDLSGDDDVPIHENSVCVHDDKLSVQMVLNVSELTPDEKTRLAAVMRERERRLGWLHGELLETVE